MARASTTSDAFNAVAEPQRRHILDLLAQGERSVSDIARALQMEQPQTSKHLKVLLEVGLVIVREDGKQRFYALDNAGIGTGLKPIHDWVKGFEQLWTERFERLDEYLRQRTAEEQPSSRMAKPIRKGTRGKPAAPVRRSKRRAAR